MDVRPKSPGPWRIPNLIVGRLEARMNGLLGGELKIKNAKLKMEWTFAMAEFYFRVMECNPIKMFRPVFVGILSPCVAIIFLLVAGGNTMPAQAQSGQSSSVSSNTSGALPATYDEWRAQDAANEKGSRSVQTYVIVAVMVLVALGFFRRWYMRN